VTFAHGETVTVARPGGVPTGAFDELGNPILSGASTFDVAGVGVAPLTPQESAELWGPDNHGGFTLLLPYGTALESSDTVTVRGESGFQVQGAADLVQWRSPFTGWHAGAVAVVRRAS
jgi:hypothetical protein